MGIHSSTGRNGNHTVPPMEPINSCLERANTPAWGQKKTLEIVGSRVFFSRKALSTQVQGSRSLTSRRSLDLR